MTQTPHTPTPFTDDDLKRLKEDMRPKKPWDYVRFDPDKIVALLTRLEAAEKLLKHSEKFCCETSMGLFLQDDLREWRKTAGK